MADAHTLERDGLSRLGEQTIADLRDHQPPRSDARRFTIRMTSGTTGRMPVVIGNEHIPGDARSFAGCKSLAICMGGNNTRLANTLLVYMQSKDPIRIIPVDDVDAVPEAIALFEDLQLDSFRGFTSFVRRVGTVIGSAKTNIRHMKLSGEKWTPVVRAAFEAAYPNATFEILYITNEIGVIGTRACESLPPNHFHPAPGVSVEIDLPDETGIGDLLISKRFFRSFAVEHYRVGDLGRYSECACGEPAFELVGRKGSDYLKIAGALLLREEFERVAALCADLFDDYRAEAGTVEGDGAPVGEIELVVECGDRPWNDEMASAIRDRFSEALFVTASKTLALLVAEGRFLPLVVKKAPAPFARANKEVKLRARPDV